MQSPQLLQAAAPHLNLESGTLSPTAMAYVRTLGMRETCARESSFCRSAPPLREIFESTAARMR